MSISSNIFEFLALSLSLSSFKSRADCNPDLLPSNVLPDVSVSLSGSSFFIFFGSSIFLDFLGGLRSSSLRRRAGDDGRLLGGELSESRRERLRGGELSLSCRSLRVLGGERRFLADGLSSLIFRDGRGGELSLSCRLLLGGELSLSLSCRFRDGRGGELSLSFRFLEGLGGELSLS